MTMTLIETITVGSGGAASVSFINVPQDFDDLLVLTSLRGNILGGILLNSTNANSSSRVLYGSGSSTSSASYTSFAYNIFQAIGRGGDTANTFGNASIYIPNYKSSSAKSLSIDSVRETNATATDLYITAGLWNNSAAVTAVSITSLDSNLNAGGVFDQYSSASLYGITKGSSSVVVS